MLRIVAATIFQFLGVVCTLNGQSADHCLLVHSGNLAQATELASSKGLNFLVILTDDRENTTYKHFKDVILKDSVVVAELYDKVLVLDETPETPNGENLCKQYDARTFPKIMFVTLQGISEFEFEGKVDPDQFIDLYNRNLH